MNGLTMRHKNVISRPCHGLSIDVEDWFQAWALSSKIAKEDWDAQSLRIDDPVYRILEALSLRQIKATFFILGWIAERRPELVREISDAGHEVASHGYDHDKVSTFDAEGFRVDVLKAKEILEDVTGRQVTGYRAPSFSIDQRTPFAYPTLEETGHLYSSSSHPIHHDHYGDPNAPLTPHIVGESLLEIPVAVLNIAGRRQTAAGGGWFRALPYAVTKRLWRQLDKDSRPSVFYFHPWEIDPDQPSVDGLSLKTRLRHRLNLGGMEGKLHQLFDDFRWGRIDDLFLPVRASHAAPAAE